MTNGKIIEEYLDKESWRVKENSNFGFSVSGMQSHVSNKIIADYWLDNIYEKKISNAHKNNWMHIHDLSHLGGYCAGWSIQDLILKGFGGVEGKVHAKPAKHFDSLLGQMVNFIGTLQNEWAGAQAFNSTDTWLAPFVREDNLTYKQVKQGLQEFIYGVNQSSRWGMQTPFLNLTFDLTPSEDLKDTYCIIGDKILGYKYKDCQKEMDMINKAFMEIMIEGDAKGRIFTFPIPTYNITNDFVWDNDVAKLLFQMTSKYGTPYFQNFINSDMKPSDVRSMCPMTGDTKVVVRTKLHGISILEIRNLKKDTDYEVWTPSGWAKAVPNKQPKQDIYELTLSNGFTIKLGENHIQPTKEETKMAKNLTTDDWIPFSKNYWSTDKGSYASGYCIGAFLGDGSYDGDNTLIFSLDRNEKDTTTELRLRSFFESSLGYSVKTYNRDNLRSVHVTGSGLKQFMKRYVKGEYAHVKEMTRHIFNASESFRRGVLDGFRDTDGARDRKRLYTTSKKLSENLCELLSSLGMKWMQTYKDERVLKEKHRMKGQINFDKKPVYRVDFPERSKYGDYFDEDENYHYFKIKEIKKISKENVRHNTQLYCFEVDNYDNLFTLASGMVTHNCRLRLSLRELENKTGGIFGAGSKTGSIGVVTLNLAKMGFVAKDIKDLYETIEKYMTLAKDSLEKKREVCDGLMDDGLYPYSKFYLGSFRNHFSTIGILGGHECCLNLLGKGIDTDEGKKLMCDVLDFMKAKLVEFQRETKHLYNLEASPAEGASYRMAKNNFKEFGEEFKQSGTKKVPFLTNSTQLPVDADIDVFDAVMHQNDLQPRYTGGTVFHLFLGERVNDWRTTKKLVKKICEMTNMPFFSITPTFSVCSQCGYLSGEHKQCPTCNKYCEVYSRVVGYLRPVKAWNDGKQVEYEKRKTFDISGVK